MASTQTERKLEDKMAAFADDPQRVAVLGKARDFKRSWIELAEALTRVRDQQLWEGWGYKTFEVYCRQELHLKTPTVSKLVGSFAFLRNQAPKVLERARGEADARPLPSMQAVDFIARAEERGAAPPEAIQEMRRAAFEEGTEAPALSRRFKQVAFPVNDQQKRDRLRAQLVSTAKRMAALIAEPDVPVPRQVCLEMEEALGGLLGALDEGEGEDMAGQAAAG